MDQVSFSPEVAGALLRKMQEVRLAGVELAKFSDQEPFLASQCGVEIAALETKTILGSGLLERLSASAAAAQRGHGFTVYRSDLDGLNRLEGVISLASARIAQQYMALEAADSNSSKLGSVIGVVSGIVGLVKTIF